MHPVRHAGRVLRLMPCLAAAALLAAVGPAAASPGLQQFTFLSPYDSATYRTGVSVVNFSFGGVGGDFYAGRYDATIGGITQRVFCTDASHDIGTNNDGFLTLLHPGNVTDAAGALTLAAPGKSYYMNGPDTGAGMASALQPVPVDYAPTNLGILSASARASEVAYLSDTYLNHALTAGFTTADLAAIQVAIWKIAQDGTTNFSSGYVQKNGSTSASALSLTLHYMTEASAYSSYQSDTAKWVQAPRPNGTGPFPETGVGSHKQDFVFLAPVPEPAFFQLALLLGAGGLGLLARSRRTAHCA